MARVLSLSLRPRTLSGLFGQESLVSAIRKQVATDRGAKEWNVWLRDFMSTSGHGFTAKIEGEAP